MEPSTRPLEAGDPANIGEYRLVGRLGAGGQGIVYLAEDASGDRYAVKTLRAGHTVARDRFGAEAAHARRVPRFCTAAVVAADFASDLPYVVSEYVQGPTLEQLVRQRGPHSGADLERLAVATATDRDPPRGAGPSRLQAGQHHHRG